MKNINLIEAFILNAIEAGKEVDYGNKIDMKRHNKAIDGYRKIAEEIKKKGSVPDLDNFIKLLDDDNWNVKIACAVCILEILDLEEYKEKALLTIKEYITYLKLHNDVTQNNIDRIGFELYLKKYHI